LPETIYVTIDSLAPKPYEILKPLRATIRPRGGEWIASFGAANQHASGSTREEALANLKDVIQASFEILSEYAPDKLGPGLAREFDVLKQFIRKRP